MPGIQGLPLERRRIMPVSKAQQRAVNKYMAANYDRINLTVPKGKKDTIQAHAAAQGESVNSFINRAIDQTMAQEAAGSPTRPAEPVVALHFEDEKCAPATSEGRTEGNHREDDA